jgi:hypothetical protein
MNAVTTIRIVKARAFVGQLHSCQLLMEDPQSFRVRCHFVLFF